MNGYILAYYTMEYHSTLKGNTDTRYKMDEPQGHYAKCNKPATKGQILYDSTYKKYLE